MRSPYTQNRNRFRFRSRSLDTHDPKQHTLAVQHHLITGHTWPRTVHTYYAASFDHWTHMTQNSIHLLSSIIWSLDTHDPKQHTLAKQHHLITGHTWPKTAYTCYAASFDHWTHLTQDSVHCCAASFDHWTHLTQDSVHCCAASFDHWTHLTQDSVHCCAASFDHWTHMTQDSVHCCAASFDTIWNRMRPRALMQNQHIRELITARKTS